MGFLAIACDSGGNLFCISLAGEDAGQVSYLDLTQERSSMYLIAADFDGFLARIRS